MFNYNNNSFARHKTNDFVYMDILACNLNLSRGQDHRWSFNNSPCSISFNEYLLDINSSNKLNA